MKEVIIILRPKRYFPTKKALDELGFSAMSMQEVIGRGKKPAHYDMDNEDIIPRLTAKRMIIIYVRDEDVDVLINTVVKLNKTHHSGDGKIFVLPVKDGVRIRTGERGNEAIL